MSGPPSVHSDIRAFGELCARCDHPFSDRAEVLSGAGLTPAQWAELRGGWCTRLAQEGEALARVFGEAYAAQWAAGPSGRSTVVAGPAAGAMPSSMAEASSASASAGEVVSTGGAGAAGTPEAPAMIESSAGAPPAAQVRPVAVPSFLRERPPAPVTAAPSMSAPAMVAPAMVAPSMEAPAMVQPAMAAPPITAPSVVAPPVAGFGATTGPMDLTAMLKKAAVPFNPSAASSIPQGSPTAPGAAGVTGTAPRPPGIGDTGDVDVSALARKVLAFGPPAKTPAAPVAPPPVATPPAAPAPIAPAPVAAVSAASAASAASAPAKPLPAFTVDQYALLSAEIVLVTDPSARAAVFARFGVDDPETLTAVWRARFAADPALAGRWSAAYAEHYARLRTERGGPR